MMTMSGLHDSIHSSLVVRRQVICQTMQFPKDELYMHCCTGFLSMHCYSWQSCTCDAVQCCQELQLEKLRDDALCCCRRLQTAGLRVPPALPPQGSGSAVSLQSAMLEVATSDPEPLLPPFVQICSCLLASQPQECDDIIMAAVSSLAGGQLQDVLLPLQAAVDVCAGASSTDAAAAAAMPESPGASTELRTAAQGLLDTTAGASMLTVSHCIVSAVPVASTEPL